VNLVAINQTVIIVCVGAHISIRYKCICWWSIVSVLFKAARALQLLAMNLNVGLWTVVIYLIIRSYYWDNTSVHPTKTCKALKQICRAISLLLAIGLHFNQQVVKKSITRLTGIEISGSK